MAARTIRIISFILLLFSAVGVTISGPLIFEWFSTGTKFFDLGETASMIGGSLDILGGSLQFVVLAYMVSNGVFSSNPDKTRSRKLFKIMAAICVIGVIGDPLGGLLAIAAQIGLYTSLVNIYLYRKQ